MVHWINTPCTDPAGRVFIADGRVYRAIFPGQEDLIRSLIDKREVRSLMDEGLIARMWPVDRKVDGFGLVVESDAAPFDVPCERYTRATLRSATLRWLEIYRRLRPAGLALSDAHYGNFMLFGANEPRWVDLGSIRPLSFVTEERPFRSFRRFWVGMLAPLALIETQPRHARYARLSIADQPGQGPLTTPDEAPLAVDAMVEEIGRLLVSEIGALDAEQALDRLRDFAAGLPRGSESGPLAEERPAASLVEEATKQFRSSEAASVVCLGTDAFRQFRSAWGSADALVIDEVESRLDRLAQTLHCRNAAGQVALCYGHPVNRLFLRNPPSGDAVLAVDPLDRYAHNSHVAADNIGHVLSVLGRKLALVVTPGKHQALAERMLGRVYASVTTRGSAWFGGGAVLVAGRR